MHMARAPKDEYRHRLAAARGKRRLSQPDAARAAGISLTTWRNVETGKHYVAGVPGPTTYSASVETLARMALAVGEDPQDIVRLAGRDPADIPWDLAHATATSGHSVAVVIVRDGTPADEVLEQVRKALDEMRGG